MNKFIIYGFAIAAMAFFSACDSASTNISESNPTQRPFYVEIAEGWTKHPSQTGWYQKVDGSNVIDFHLMDETENTIDANLQEYAEKQYQELNEHCTSLSSEEFEASKNDQAPACYYGITYNQVPFGQFETYQISGKDGQFDREYHLYYFTKDQVNYSLLSYNKGENLNAEIENLINSLNRNQNGFSADNSKQPIQAQENQWFYQGKTH